eukprot:9482973-Pyramimonas_sp.AAC.1
MKFFLGRVSQNCQKNRGGMRDFINKKPAIFLPGAGAQLVYLWKDRDKPISSLRSSTGSVTRMRQQLRWPLGGAPAPPIRLTASVSCGTK